jgi:hypothetical protein
VLASNGRDFGAQDRTHKLRQNVKT